MKKKIQLSLSENSKKKKTLKKETQRYFSEDSKKKTLDGKRNSKILFRRF